MFRCDADLRHEFGGLGAVLGLFHRILKRAFSQQRRKIQGLVPELREAPRHKTAMLL